MTHLRADEWTVATVPNHADAVALVRRWHYSRSAPNTSTYRHGLHRVDLWPFVGELMGVAMWMPPTRRAAEAVAGEDWQGVLCLTRLVVVPEVPTNGASFLLGRSMGAIDRNRWPVLLTYADTAQGHTGAIYKATNWTEQGETPAGDTWRTPEGAQVGRKRGRFTYTKAEMEAMGCVRETARPKLRFVHDARKVRAA